MFNQMSNAVFSNGLFSCVTIPDMHKTMERLTKAAFDVHGIATPSELAVALYHSDQVVNNWKRRGVSCAGQVAAQEYLGISPLWISKGVGSVVIGRAGAWPFDIDYALYDALLPEKKADLNTTVCALINSHTKPKKNNGDNQAA